MLLVGQYVTDERVLWRVLDLCPDASVIVQDAWTEVVPVAPKLVRPLGLGLRGRRRVA